MKSFCDNCGKKFNYVPVIVESHILLTEGRLYFCSYKCFNDYKTKHPESSVVKYIRKEEK